MVVLIYIGLLVVIILAMISPTVDAESDIFDGLDGDLYSTNSPGGPLSLLSHQTACPLIIDDDSAEYRDWAPWTYPPICIPPKESGDAIPPESSKLCVFTVLNLRGGPGISLITTPAVASNLASTLQDPDVSWLELKRGFPLASSFPPSRLPYDIKEIPGKGIGVIANAPIAKGQILMVELPILLQLNKLDAWDIRGLFELLQHAATRLAKSDRDRLLQMARQGKGYLVDDIMKTNSFQVTVSGVQHSGLYPEIARLNHACRPNCFTRFSPTTLAMEVVAYTNIKPDEELSLSYLPLNLISKQRQETLHHNWGFKCTCSLCANAKSTIISDHQRARLAEILDDMNDTPPRALVYEDFRHAIIEIEELADKEGLTAQIGDLYGKIFDVWLRMGDTTMAREFAAKAVKMQRHFAGVDNERTLKALAKLDRIRS